MSTDWVDGLLARLDLSISITSPINSEQVCIQLLAGKDWRSSDHIRTELRIDLKTGQVTVAGESEKGAWVATGDG